MIVIYSKYNFHSIFEDDVDYDVDCMLSLSINDTLGSDSVEIKLDDDDMEEYNKTVDYCRGIVNNLKFSKK